MSANKHLLLILLQLEVTESDFFHNVITRYRQIRTPPGDFHKEKPSDKKYEQYVMNLSLFVKFKTAIYDVVPPRNTDSLWKQKTKGIILVWSSPSNLSLFIWKLFKPNNMLLCTFVSDGRFLSSWMLFMIQRWTVLVSSTCQRCIQKKD